MNKLSTLIMEDFVLISPLQLIVFEYTYSQCDECKLYFDESYECSKCKTIRCKFHHFVCSDISVCINCYDDSITRIKAIITYHKLYTCKYCYEPGLIGTLEYEFVCNTHFRRLNAYNIPNELISFESYCSMKNCPGTGYFFNTYTEKKYCIKHIKTQNSSEIIYNYTQPIGPIETDD
jgi:hypothetical protein